MNELSNRAISLLKNLAHLDSTLVNQNLNNVQIWEYKFDSCEDKARSNKILTLFYGVCLYSNSNLDLILTESFAVLAESRSIEEIYYLKLREVESFLRDSNHVPSIPKSIEDKANISFENIKLNFFEFLIFKEFHEKYPLGPSFIDWEKSTLAEKVRFILIIINHLHQYLGRAMPKTLLYVDHFEIGCSYPVNYDPFSERVIVHILNKFGANACLKLVAV
jgi:hypothetical protein